MKMLLSQPVHETNIETLEKKIIEYPDVTYFLFPEGYIKNEESLQKAKQLATKYEVSIITSLRKNSQDIAIVISDKGQVIYERLKTKASEEVILTEPLTFFYHNQQIGFLLCMEILKGSRDLPQTNFDFIVHPIGVGMFSEEQLDLWLNEAQKIAKQFNTIVLGTSHSDGSYKNCGVSIPIAYCIDNEGKLVCLLKDNSKDQIIEFYEGKTRLEVVVKNEYIND